MDVEGFEPSTLELEAPCSECIQAELHVRVTTRTSVFTPASEWFHIRQVGIEPTFTRI